MLRDVAVVLAPALRPGDLLYRSGDDQLAVLLPATSARDAELVADRLATMVEGHAVEAGAGGRPETAGVCVGWAIAVGGVAERVVADAEAALDAALEAAQGDQPAPSNPAAVTEIPGSVDG